MKDRFELSIRYDGTNGIKHITSYGDDIHECLENMINEIEQFKNEFTNNNFDNGGYTAFTKDAKKLFDECDDIIKEIEKLEEK